MKKAFHSHLEYVNQYAQAGIFPCCTIIDTLAFSLRQEDFFSVTCFSMSFFLMKEQAAKEHTIAEISVY